MATSNSDPCRRPRRFGTVALKLPLLLLAMLCLVPSAQLAAPPAPKDFQHHLERIRAAFEQARSHWLNNSNLLDASWQYGRAAFDWAEFATNDQQRATVAELGIAACRHALKLDSNSVAAHYYLALNLGQLARTKLLGALKLIDEMELAWIAAIRLDPQFDHGGPHRAIGVLYRDAPGWPTSIGSEKKSRQNLEKALELHPEYPGNRLSLYEGYIQWGDRKTVLDKAAETEAFLRKARTEFTGERWALDWDDWDRRWADIKRKAGLKSSETSDSSGR